MARLAGYPLQILLCLLLSAYTQAQLLIPAPKGQYAVGQNTIKLVDTSRTDPYDPSHGHRAVMTSLFYPVPKRSCTQICPVPYMPPVTASYIDASVAALGIPNGTFESIRMQACCSVAPKAKKDITKVPVILFSGGLQGTRLLYSALAQTLASAGYAVITMDHTYETSIVEFPDGTIIPGLNDTNFDPEVPGLLDSVLAIRAADARFVLTQMGLKSVVQKLIPGAACGFNVKNGNAAFYGHSFGGATAIAALMHDSRLAAAINLDGMQFGNLTDTKKPALLVGRAEPSPHNRTTDATWAQTWTHFKGWRREVAVAKIEHNTFGDTGLLIKLSGLPVSDDIKSVIGSLDGGRSFTVITEVVRTFFDLVLKGKKTGLFEKGSKDLPEVVVG
ncbi:PAF acetylhydrolase family protein [Melanomma pulvis-pyrius CBS 109.77]|uniref:1-alkyl-2-acetylglycerophosphocholine esterase n=1 Tax=Melanomma pulvis-pyrius CBS 109.77 TaxID=1314802 RepID=A0A6A6X288_9PLEO|nr:PAF acetylhydrolase family protein [Melanomma pulvis-pyrius CBS 109.77]